jgi:restriction system protein
VASSRSDKSAWRVGTNDELLDKVIELERVSDAVQNIMHTDRQTKLGYRLARAKSCLGIAGALENRSHGVWAITEKGNALTATEVDQIPGEVRKLYKVEKGKKPKDLQEAEDLSPELKYWKDGLLAHRAGHTIMTTT